MGWALMVAPPHHPLPLVRERSILCVAIGVGFGCYNMLRRLGQVVGLVNAVWRWFRFILIFRSYALGVWWASRLAVVSSYLIVRFAKGVGFGSPLSRWLRILYNFRRSRWVLGLCVPLSRWFRIFFPVLRSR